MLDWDRQASAAQLAQAGLKPDQTARWHQHAGWIKPSSLVRAWLSQTGVEFQGHGRVDKLLRTGGLWHCLSVDGESIAASEFLLVAAGPGSTRLLEDQIDLAPVAGTVSWGHPGPAQPPFPVNGHGSFIPAVSSEHGRCWYLGASYHRDPSAELPSHLEHVANLARLKAMLPQAAAALASDFTDDKPTAWTGIRATTRDHLPIAGPIDEQASPGLWVACGMGSRGLTFAMLCAELLAAQLCGEPWPLGRKMAAALAPGRRSARSRNHVRKVAL